jgi:hypothetical protein
MPSNPIDEFTAGLQPADILTLFAGLRSTIPVYAALGATGTNEGHDEELARRRGPATMPAPPTVDPAESNRRAMQDFEAQYPDPHFRQMLINAMLRERHNPYSATTATRRRDFEEAPATARHSMQAAPRKYANGGAIDFSTPDMADGGAFIPDPQPFNKGGSAKKTLDEMAAEMMRKGVKLADKPDLSRRSFFGLGKGPDFPLSKVDTKTLESMNKNAPAITEKSVTIDPGKGAAKSTLKSVSETPLSRRQVLQSAAGQVVRGALPDLGGLSAMGNVAKAVESAAPVAAVTADMIPSLMMSAIKKGMSEKEAVKFVRSQLGDAPPTKGFDPSNKEFQLEVLHRHLSDPMDAPNDWEFFGPMLPSGALNVMLHTPGGNMPPMQLRGALRQIREADPERYRQMIDSAKDFSMGSFETTLESGMMTPRNLEKYRKGEHAQPVYRPEHLWNND